MIIPIRPDLRPTHVGRAATDAASTAAFGGANPVNTSNPELSMPC
jgi:hypothetical protein